MRDDKALHMLAGGILIRSTDKSEVASFHQSFQVLANRLGLNQVLQTVIEDAGKNIRFRSRRELTSQHEEIHDTLQLSEIYHLHPQTSPSDLEKEIILSMLIGPVTFEYPSYAEFISSVRIRRNIVEAAQKTALAFHTHKIERPEDFWTHTEDSGFTVLPGKALTNALLMATQPEVSGKKYSFSCYRATEYVILLGIAQELVRCNPDLLQQVQRQWETRAIMSRQFHEVFIYEYGSMDKPLPPKYYVPGDRLWFRNPDEASSEVTGYEGSWVFYLGGGLFTNFWERDKPFTLASKCIEIYHWRHGVFQDTDGNFRMNEAVVEERVRNTLRDPVAAEDILTQMMRLRDPQGVYADGGCIDATREYPRRVCPGSADMILPGL